MGDYLNIMAVAFVLLAFFTARQERRLPLLILCNYAAYGVLVLLSEDYENDLLFGDSDLFGLWYLINALRELVVLAFVFEALLKARRGRGPIWCYMLVVLISLSASLLLTLSDMTGEQYLWSIHIKAIYLIPFAEIILAWWGSDNLLHRRYSTRPLQSDVVPV
ncbi:hypothetical protein [Gallaecimonas xiamenensis]|uniref:Uncharacterized protein n=1 Tax=Gallaecimonas xiamenensis 3-C-1 TaxID=745411 RepID=K2JK93_9GAMM|nr:hypothetical protein [Gallaecimonas xiamenensis]EKE75708.1 hypothetical protein B3C1_06498 [Gallaecimonas xiamenensis 3-C-1]